jgi:hypothetical protein
LGHSFDLIPRNLLLLEEFYLPISLDYSEYDFLNQQSLESLEDSFWELGYPTPTPEYFYSFNNLVGLGSFFDRFTESFNTYTRQYSPKANTFTKLTIPNISYINSESFLLRPFLLNLGDFSYYNTNTYHDSSLEDSYENLKSLHTFLTVSPQHLIISKNMSPLCFSQATVLNLFRANFEELNWSSSDSFSSHVNNIFNRNTPFYLTNSLKLRTTLKNLIVTHGAIQKVYKSRFDDGRSNMNSELIFNSYSNYPLLTGLRGSYELALSKNKETFFNYSLFNTEHVLRFSPMDNIFTGGNFMFLDIPFLLSLKSDASRYL